MERTGENMSKTVVLGIDGATPSLLLPWAKQGRLPNLGRVLRDGAHGTLRSTTPPYSAQAWVSMMTGRQPSKHGVVDFFEREAGRPKHAFIHSASIQGEALWDILSRDGKRVGIVNVPLTYPPVPVNGYMVSGFMTPKGRDDYTHPPELRDSILSVTGQYDPDPWDLTSPGQDLESFGNWMAIAELAACHLHDTQDVDFYISVIQALDQLQHHFWDLLADEEARFTPRGKQVWPSLEACYAAMDEAIGTRLTWLDGDTTLFLASDHGFQAARSWFHVNRWLADSGFLHFAASRATRGRSMLAKMGLTRENVKTWVRRLDPLSLRRALGRFTRAAIADSLDDTLALPVDWARTEAYSGSRTSEGIYINLKGREANGIVSPGANYETVRNRVIEELVALTDPFTGQPAVSAVYRREELYSGEYLERMPDILFALDDKPYLVSESTSTTQVFGPLSTADVTGRHHSLGLFAAVGPNIVPGIRVEAQIVDLAPTVLYSLGLPIPQEMDGRVLVEIFVERYRRLHPVRYEDAGYRGPAADPEPAPFSAEEDADIEDRLRALGYLD